MPLISVDPNRFRLIHDAGSARPEGVLLGCRCEGCGVVVFGSATFCQHCTSDRLKPVELSREGALYSYTIVRAPPAGWPGPVPYILGQILLPEGPQVLAEVIDCDPEDLAVGMPVELAVHLVTEADSDTTRAVYKWRPTSTTS